HEPYEGGEDTADTRSQGLAGILYSKWTGMTSTMCRENAGDWGRSFLSVIGCYRTERVMLAARPKPAALSGRRAAGGLPGVFAGLADGRTAGRWLPVARGRHQGGRRWWKRPL